MVEAGDEEALCSENEPISATLDPACQSSHAQRGFFFIDFHKVCFIHKVSLHIKDYFNATV